MNSNSSVLFFATALFGLATFSIPNFAIADPCWLTNVDDPQHARKISDLVFIGTATAKWTEIHESADMPDGGWIVGERTTFEVHSVEKGEIKPGAEQVVEKGKQCSCAGKFEIGKKYLVHARLLAVEKLPTLHLCDFNKEIE